MRATFDVDWDLAVKAHGLRRFMAKANAAAQGTSEEEQAKEVAEAKEAVWKRWRLIYGAFDFYAIVDPPSAPRGFDDARSPHTANLRSRRSGAGGATNERVASRPAMWAYEWPSA